MTKRIWLKLYMCQKGGTVWHLCCKWSNHLNRPAGLSGTTFFAKLYRSPGLADHFFKMQNIFCKIRTILIGWPVAKRTVYHLFLARDNNCGKGTCQKRFSGFCPLRGEGYPPFPLRVFGQDDFPLRGGGLPPNSAKKRLFLAKKS